MSKVIDWKFKADAKPQGSSDGFWYDLVMGGYIKPEEVLADEEQYQMVADATETLKSFETALQDEGLLEEF
ncbi:hypothetical protein LCGC14_2153650 [marine sediment metagenome]|uniref:Uncharacterized protein n=1 Tax=marine sediment metagenome TaxID=412755 RepID=A0A0F9GR62_9ZZZZ